MDLQETVDRAFALQRMGSLDEAERLYGAALEQLPAHADLLFNHATILHALGRDQLALARFERVLQLRPRDASAWNSQGALLAQAGRLSEAFASFERAAALRPEDSGAWQNMGAAQMGLGQFPEAVASFDRALSINPNIGQAWHDRGLALRAGRRFDEALQSLDKAAELDADAAAVHLSRGLVLVDLDRFELALAAFDQALMLAPRLPEALNNRGLVEQYLGQGDAAQRSFAEAVSGDGAPSAAYLNYAAAATVTETDPHLPLIEAARNAAGLSPTCQVRLDFALAKAYGDMGLYRRSFDAMKRGNDAQRARLPYDERGELAYFERLAQTFDRHQIARLRSLAPGDTQTPNLIFIVGMPRSGTTLLEQIMASHPQVHGGGELTALHDAVRTVGEDRHFPPSPQSAPLLDRYALSDIASRYLSVAGSGLGEKTHLVDKMPSNFHHLGLIGAVLPGARLIHCVRDPLDTCFSRYAKLFLDQNAYSYDLGELGRYHRAYERLMAHWRETLPSGALLEVRYEDVIADLESQARRMLDFCGLSWTDRCLAFEQTQRAVRTPSALQVRQPLYGAAIGRAKPYEAFLGPLKTALDGG